MKDIERIYLTPRLLIAIIGISIKISLYSHKIAVIGNCKQSCFTIFKVDVHRCAI